MAPRIILNITGGASCSARRVGELVEPVELELRDYEIHGYPEEDLERDERDQLMLVHRETFPATETARSTVTSTDDPTLAVWFDPAALREHFAETEHEAACRALSDTALTTAARYVIVDSERLWALFDDLCLDVLEHARGLEATS